MREKRQIFCGSFWFYFMLTAMALIVFALCALGIDNVYSKNKQKVIDTPPSEYDIEEELEYHLASTDVIIIDTEQDEDVLIAKVWANGGIFRAEYRIDNYIFDFYWKLVDVKMVGVGERP